MSDGFNLKRSNVELKATLQHGLPTGRVEAIHEVSHVRYFGNDVRDRITKVGLSITEYTAVEPDVRIYGLIRGETLFVATKQ